MRILITGVTKGLGRALAEWYIKNGHTVVGCGPIFIVIRWYYTDRKNIGLYWI